MNTNDMLIELGEMFTKFRQTANRSLRKTYAERARMLLKEAEKNIDKSNPERWAGFRSLRNQWLEQLEYQFPEIQRADLVKSVDSGLGDYCFGIIENTFTSVCNWYTLAGIGGILYLVGRAHQKAMKKKRARMARQRARRNRMKRCRK